MNSQTSTGPAKLAAGLSVNEIMSDLERMPMEQEQQATSDSTMELPESSDSVDSSMAISSYFIENSRKLLADSEALDGINGRLDAVDATLCEIEASLQQQQEQQQAT